MFMSGAHRADPTQRLDEPAAWSTCVVPSAEAMRDFGGLLAGVLQAGDLVVLTGDLGAGKTTLTQGVGARLQVRGDVTSPTFVIARVHPPLAGGPALVHVDAYRLETLSEVDDLDLDASLGESVTVVEWGEGLVEGLAADRLEVRLERRRGAAGPDDAEVSGDEPRTVRVRGYGRRWAGVELPLLG
jgi:tRNA threonylcarbamoyladenosine biosynthesis protein TsaE